MSDSWNKLLQKIGIAKTFTDGSNQEHSVDDETLRQMVNHLGFPLKNIADSDKLLAKLENKRLQSVFESIYVVHSHNITIDIVLPKSEIADLQLYATAENNPNIHLDYTLQLQQEFVRGKTAYQLLQIHIQTPLTPDYYRLEAQTPIQKHYTTLAVTPDKCYIPDLLQTQKLWGFAIQLYSLTSNRNWGVGDFTDLQNFAAFCARQGADVIGINPLNVLFHDFPDNASPYSSISRLYLNPIYIDVEKIPGYREEYLTPYTADLQKARQSENIDYDCVYNLKIKIIRQIFTDNFTAIQKDDAFKEYCRQEGTDLENLATFQSIYSQYCHKISGGWRSWPKELQNPHTKEVKAFQKEHANDILFFKYLQFLTAQQLTNAQKSIQSAGLKIGLYRDLPVGLCKDSAELWTGYDLFIKDCGAGAPPDAFFPTGQKWCLGAFNPYILKAEAYMPFIKILRSAMAGAGALRIDHVMSLMRLYIIPDCGDNGTYVYYNFDDMLGIVALESYRNHCMVVGESIGNVPDGFIEKLHERGIYSLSVLWAERWNGCGDFKIPENFPQTAFSSVGTHDIAPLRMRWFGYDIETMYQLGMLSAQERQEQYHARENERCCLLKALDYSGVWPQDNPRQGDCLFGEGYPNGLTEAVEKYVSSGNCAVYLAQLEDIFDVEVLQNLPGTDRDKHPNWQRKLPVKIEDYESDSRFERARKAIQR